MPKLSEPVFKALETLLECHNNDTKTVVHLIARATKYGNSDEVELLRCANFNDILSALVYSFDLARSAPETTASPSETAAVEGILTEEELNSYEAYVPAAVINSHQLALKEISKLRKVIDDIYEVDTPFHEEDCRLINKILNDYYDKENSHE